MDRADRWAKVRTRVRYSGIGLAAVLMAAGLAGCGQSGVGGGTAGGAATGAAKPAVLAKIGSTTITTQTMDDRIKDLPTFAQAEFKGEDGRKRLLDRMVEEEVLYQAALDAGLASDPEVSKKLRESRRRTLVESYYTKYVQDAAKPTEAEVQQYYKEHAAEFTEPDQVRVRHILLKTEGDAKKLRARIAAGEIDFETAARLQSTDVNSKEQAGLVAGYLAQGRPVGALGMLPEFVTAALALEPGQLSAPVKTQAGWHLIKVEEKKPSRVRPLEEVREQIEARGSGERVRQKFTEQLDTLKAKYKVQVTSAATAETGPAESAEAVFQQAQETSDPKARIALYEKVLNQFPKDKRCYEAQFMIGFVYSEDLKDYPRAKEAFEKLIQNYPDCDLAESARWMIGNMHLDTPAFLQQGGETAGETKPPVKKTG